MFSPAYQGKGLYKTFSKRVFTLIRFQKEPARNLGIFLCKLPPHLTDKCQFLFVVIKKVNGDSKTKARHLEITYSPLLMSKNVSNVTGSVTGSTTSSPLILNLTFLSFSADASSRTITFLSLLSKREIVFSTSLRSCCFIEGLLGSSDVKSRRPYTNSELLTSLYSAGTGVIWRLAFNRFSKSLITDALIWLILRTRCRTGSLEIPGCSSMSLSSID